MSSLPDLYLKYETDTVEAWDIEDYLDSNKEAVLQYLDVDKTALVKARTLLENWIEKYYNVRVWRDKFANNRTTTSANMFEDVEKILKEINEMIGK